MFLRAQNAGATFQFLQLPVSSHAAALGGDNVSIIEDDAELSFHNPALLTNVSPRMLGFNYMNYLQRTNVMGAGYTMAVGERSMVGVKAQYLDFGTMKNTDADGNILGNFSAKDMLLMGTYSFDFSNRLTGGVNGKIIYSSYEHVYSLALGVDLGLNYYNPVHLLSISLVARNLGGQVKTYDGTHEGLPFNLLVGVSKDFAYAPVRLSLTLTDLHKWQAGDFYNSGDDSWGNILLKHFILGADIFPTHNTYLSIGYNFLLHSELKIHAKRSLEGLAIGAGLQVNRVKVGLSYGKYHVAASSLMMNFALVL
ncbi:MAG: type IX secretion system protein PorQ [Bacteroidaceae bacterium]|nr:type IX secretion system protein PorQ [Bacteroidaceae bacterium]